MAVGYYITVLGFQQSMSMTLAAGRWTTFTLVPPANASPNYGRAIACSVACTGNARCTAVGWYLDTQVSSARKRLLTADATRAAPASW